MTDDRYPHVAGHRRLGGSVEASHVMTPKLPQLQAAVVAVVERAGAYGATGDEIAAALGWDKFRVRPRTAELRKLGKIMDSRKRRKSEAGIMSIVWVLPCYSQPIVMGEAA
jgi:transcription initiation factor IIE alpha subunit